MKNKVGITIFDSYYKMFVDGIHWQVNSINIYKDEDDKICGFRIIKYKLYGFSIVIPKKNKS